MKICFVAPANNYHTKKWANWFSERGHEIHVVSFVKAIIPGVDVHFVDTGAGVNDKDFSKLKYLLHARSIRRIIKSINPDIVNVHYASSYGAVVALSGIRPYVLSVWGSDIYDFPNRSLIHKALLKFSLRNAAYLFSTSHSMAIEGSKYTKKQFEITPFGVDMDLFNPGKRTKTEDSCFTIGTVKALSELYGIDYILKAVASIRKEWPEIDIRVRISGEGPQGNEYRKLACDLGIDNITTFLGHISQEDAAREWASMDVGVIPSTRYESFGVAAVEAQASGTPIIVSDVAGLLETTSPGQSSIVVPRKDADSITKAIVRFYQDPELRKKMGAYGRDYVLKRYELNHCFERIENRFKEMSLRKKNY